MNSVLLFKVDKPISRRAILRCTPLSQLTTGVQLLQNDHYFFIRRFFLASLTSGPKTVDLSHRADVRHLKWRPATPSGRLFCRGLGSIALSPDKEGDLSGVDRIAHEPGNQVVSHDKAKGAENHYEEEEDEEEDADAAMATYEEFFLSMGEASSAQPDSTSTPRMPAAVEEGGAGKVTLMEAVSTMVREAASLLPEDGRAMRLTDLTPQLDVEAISELAGGGSVLSFLQSFPDVFTLTASEGQDISGGSLGVGRVRRWYVSRPKLRKTLAEATLPTDDSGCALAMKTGDLGDLYAEEELRALVRPASCAATSIGERGRFSTSTASNKSLKCRQSRTLRSVSDTMGGHASISTLDWSLLATALPPSRPLPVLQVMQEIASEEFSRQVRSSGKGLIRLFHEQYEVAKHHVILSAENNLIARSGELHDIPAWSPDIATVQLAKDSDPNENSSVDDSFLDEEEEVSVNDPFVEDNESVAVEVGQDGAEWAATTTDCPSVFYDGLSTPRKKSSATSHASTSKKPKQPTKSSNVPAIPSSKLAGSPTETANQVSIPDKVHSGSQKKRKHTTTKCSSSESLKKNPQELQAAHTKLAIQHGWRTPIEMLDFFIECIPTFFVPVPELVLTDVLVKILGPQNTISHVVKVYSYFFEYDKHNNQARLAPTLQHSRMGQANVHYPRWDPRDLAGAHDTAQESASRSPARPFGLTLQSTAATSSFPVLKPIIRSSRSPSNTNSLITTNKNTSHTARESTTASLLSLQRPSRSSIFSELESTVHSQPLRTLLQIISKVPYDRFVSLAEVAKQADVTTSELETVIQADEAIIENSNNHHHLFITVAFPHDDGGKMVRLRPYWLAPNSLGELRTEDLPVEVSEALRPTWIPIPKLLSKISEDSRAQLMRFTGNVQTGSRNLHCGKKDNGDQLPLIMRNLRLAGRCCWVDPDMMRVRRYTANADLDDFTHISVHLLSHFSSHVFEPVDVVLDRADVSLSELLHTTKMMCGMEGGLTALCRHAMQSRHREFVEFLQFHKKVLEVSVADDNHSVCIRRKTSFVSFGSRT
ncbi:unnamed protein product [Phytomonas sp. Hart1]|nr:unnamed protein product [Phytomonas sp. Hart1]|eukprot:CCW69580.1 unnamed protein product [Phytomonas sp. isolate Hart1]